MNASNQFLEPVRHFGVADRNRKSANEDLPSPVRCCFESKGCTFGRIVGEGSYNKVRYFFERNGYTFGRIVGEGTYCKVRMAFKGGTQYAVKIIDRRHKSEEFLKKFLPRELDIIQKVNHRNIIKVFDVIDCKTHVFIFMEPVDRGDLLDYVKSRTRLSESEARHYFLQLTSAIQYLHARNICHRDLKCENILLTDTGIVKIIDFGFCRICVDQNGKRILSQTYCGSTAYAAPEVIMGEPYNPMMNDIWSLGCVLFIMVSGTMPFDDTNVNRMLHNQHNRRIRYTGAVNLLSNEVKDLFCRMLEPDVTRRATLNQIINSPWCRQRDSAQL